MYTYDDYCESVRCQCRPDMVEAVQKLCDERNGNALSFMSYCLHVGLGMPVNIPESVRYCKMSADEGNSASQYTYGRYTFFGQQGYSKNEEEGLRYIKMAVEQEQPDAMYLYGSMLYNGYGSLVPMDRKLANYYMDRGENSELAQTIRESQGR